jgi:hypothetical protein
MGFDPIFTSVVTRTAVRAVCRLRGFGEACRCCRVSAAPSRGRACGCEEFDRECHSVCGAKSFVVTLRLPLPRAPGGLSSASRARAPAAPACASHGLSLITVHRAIYSDSDMDYFQRTSMLLCCLVARMCTIFFGPRHMLHIGHLTSCGAHLTTLTNDAGAIEAGEQGGQPHISSSSASFEKYIDRFIGFMGTSLHMPSSSPSNRLTASPRTGGSVWRDLRQRRTSATNSARLSGSATKKNARYR